MSGRYSRAIALFILLTPVARTSGQDSPRMARALERAEKFDIGLGQSQRPSTQWLGVDRVAFSATGTAPWSIIEASTGRVLQTGAGNDILTEPGPPPEFPSWLARRDRNAPFWTVRTENADLVISDDGGTTRLRLQGAPRYMWGMPPEGGNRDQKVFIALRIDQRAVHTLPIVDYSTPVERLTYAPYPKTGTNLPVTELYVVDPAAGKTRPVQLDARDSYVWFLGWRYKANEALAMRMSRNAKKLELFAIDPSTGATRLIAHDERPATFIGGLEFQIADWQYQFTPLSDDSGFLWMSERDGWRHVYHYGYDGVVKKQLTSGNFPVHRVVRVDSASRQVYLLASADSTNPYDRHVYRVALDGSGFTALTTAPGLHQPVFSSAGNIFIDNYSSIAQPTTMDLRRDDGTLIKRLGQASTASLVSVGYTPPQPFRVKAADGKTDLYGVLYRPADFDSTKRYPIIDYIYAGPFEAEHQVTYAPATGMHRISATLAQMGFVVAMVDARGTPGRGKAFQDANYGRIGRGEIEIPDHVAALRELARSRPYMDTSRVGVVGHSWGGYFALNAMLTAPDFFKVGYAGAPGDLTEAASINEPNMGLLMDNAAGYEMGSNVGRASALRGKLKIMHGTSDTMAPFSTTMRMIQALIAANKTFDLLVMPGQPHGPAGAQGKYYREDVRRFMATYLGGEVLHPEAD